MKALFREIKQNIIDLWGNVIGAVKRAGHDFGSDGRMKPIIVFVPGYTFSYYTVWPNSSITKLRREGYWVIGFNPGKNTNRDVREHAQDLKNFIEEVCAREKIDDLVIVAHSMGGVTSRYYLEKLGGEKRVRKLIAISSPFAGTRSAYLALHTRAARHMTPRSKFIKELQEFDKYVNRVVSIRAVHDQTIWPTASSVLPGAKNIQLPITGHNYIKESDEVVEIIKKELS